MHRRDFLRHAAVASGALATGTAAIPAHALRADTPAAPPGASDLVTAPATGSSQPAIADLTAAEAQRLMTAGQTSAHDLARAYLARIEAVDRNGPRVNSVIEVNPDALAIAAERDAERRDGRVRGPLHGIPVLLKDNIDTGDRMLTTAGSLALAGAPAPRDAVLVARLREAGAVILGKTNLSEWANFRSTRSVSGWSARGGQTRNPYALDRSPCGSSSGSGAAIAAGLAILAVGTETDGSVTCPSAVNGLVGLKPTVGAVSRTGVIPISASQDTAGPMTRTVHDAALLLDVLAGRDEADEATRAFPGAPVGGYAAGLRPDALRGARIGVARNIGPQHGEVQRVFEDALRALQGAGAELVDPANITTAGRFDDAEFTVLLYEFQDGLARYFAARGDTSPLRTLADVRDFNAREATREMPWFGQELVDMALAKGPLTDAAYREARATCVQLARVEGLDACFRTHRVDAIVAPTTGPAWTVDVVNGDHYLGGAAGPAAVAGYPHLTVPMGQVQGLPVGLSFMGHAWEEARLLSLGYAFEQATKARRAPAFRERVG
jgi:amidase